MTGELQWVRGWVIPLDPDPDAPLLECCVCGFDAVVRFPLYLLTPEGVTATGRVFPLCGRCCQDRT